MSASTDPSISVVMPCYNAMPYLPQALDSALAQTHRPVQIIVVDDGSTDQGPRVLVEYARGHPEWIQVIRQANAGEPAARNAGIAAATGQWVAMLDGDDWWEPDKLQAQLAAAAAAGDDCVLVHTGVVHHYPDDRIEPQDLVGPGRRVGRCTAALLELTSIGHPSVMLRRAALERIGGYDASFRQACDIDLYFRLSAVGSFAFVPRHLLHYRLHAKQMSASRIEQIGYYHRAVRQFFAAHPAQAQAIGPERIDAALAQQVAMRLEGMYWKRQLGDFRRLLAYATENRLDSPAIRAWRRKARWPDWLIRLRDGLGRTAVTRAAV